ncbi:MAG: hypothetical protein HQK51_19930, partial [Oligoflexia bacterium]|nr:hypothetical protein [Oligoflexia bacterium]
PIEYYYAYNPRKMTGEEAEAPFKTLCPDPADTVVVFAFTDYKTHKILSIPIVSCSGVVYPLKNNFFECEARIKEIKKSVDFNKVEFLENKAMVNQLSDIASVVDYKIIHWNDYSESEYIECSKGNSSFCLNLCASETVCTYPIDIEANKNFIIEFGKHNYKSCDSKYFSNKNFIKYLQKSLTTTVKKKLSKLVFSADSLSLTFESPYDDSTNDNFDIINDMLENFEGIFDRENYWERPEHNEFIFSNKYRNKINERLKALCVNSEVPYILGMEGKPLLVVCRSGDFYEVRPLIKNDEENCFDKQKEIFEIIGSTGE